MVRKQDIAAAITPARSLQVYEMAKVAKVRQKTKTVSYDVAEQLPTPEEMAAYLDAWFVEAPDDATGIVRALGDTARAKGSPSLPKTQA